MQLLKDLMNKCVPPEQVDWAALADQILLEQFMRDLEGKTQLWVWRHLPRTAEEALIVAEAFAASEVEHLQEKGY